MPGGLPADQVIGRHDRGFAGIENRTALLQSLDRMSDDDRKLLHLYFVEERTQTQVAEVLGCSQMQVSRLLRTRTRGMSIRMQVFLALALIVGAFAFGLGLMVVDRIVARAGGMPLDQLIATTSGELLGARVTAAYASSAPAKQGCVRRFRG